MYKISKYFSEVSRENFRRKSNNKPKEFLASPHRWTVWREMRKKEQKKDHYFFLLLCFPISALICHNYEISMYHYVVIWISMYAKGVLLSNTLKTAFIKEDLLLGSINWKKRHLDINSSQMWWLLWIYFVFNFAENLTPSSMNTHTHDNTVV